MADGRACENPMLRVLASAAARKASPARGRYAPRAGVEDHLQATHAVIDLPREQPSAKRFLQAMVRELKIRCYQSRTIKSYRNAVRNLLRWFGGPPHLITREDVRCYLEVLVDGGADASWIGTNLSAIRTLFDKCCYQSITLGLVSPRRRKKLPVVLSRQEIVRLLEASVSLRDKLLLGLMYATGVRVSEVVRLRWRDFDFDRFEKRGRVPIVRSTLRAVPAIGTGPFFLGQIRYRRLFPGNG